MSSGPPPILRRLLAWILPKGSVRDGLLGDLDELYAERVGRGRVRANVWYARQVVSAAGHYALRHRWRLRAEPPREARLSEARLMDDFVTDLGYAWRTLLRSPGFTAIVVLTLALGIGATTAIFSVVDAALLRPLPYPDPDRLVRLLHHHRDDADVRAGTFSREDFADLQQEAAAYESVAAFLTGTRVLTDIGEPQEIPVAHVTTNFFQTLGVSAALGRAFGAEEDRAGADHVVVLSDGFWSSRFGSDAGAIGGTVTLDGTAFTILGVMPPSFDYPSPETDVFFPVSLLGCDDINCSRASRFLFVIARLAPGATLPTASAETRAIFERLEQAYPQTNADRAGTVMPLRESLVGDVRPQLLILLGAVGFLLLITCANVANLLLARGTKRSREFAIRAALGAGRSRVMRQVLTESLVLAGAGGALGFLLAFRGVDLLVAFGAGSLPRSHAIQTDLRIAAFALLASIVTGVLFSLLPSVTASRLNVQDDLKAGGRSGAPRLASRGLLVGVEAALAVILVTGAALLVQSFWKLTRVDTGFTAENVLSLSIRTDGDVMSGEERNAYRREIVRRIEELPGVLAVGGAKDVPLHGVSEGYSFTLPGRPDEPAITPETLIVTGSYFDALGIPLLAGRLFTATDETDRALVVIVDRNLARRYWADGEAVGETVLLSGRVEVQVVGVVGNVRYEGITRVPTPTLYVLPHFGGRASMTLFVRTASNPLATAEAVQHAIWQVNPGQSMTVSTMSQVVSTTVAEPRFITVLLASFAGLAIVLAGLGVYGVTTYEVGRRTYEVGVRIAFGARAPDVLRLILREAAAPMLLGLIVGLAAARALAGLLTALLYGVEATDPFTFLTVPLLLCSLGLVAIYVPARRATRVDPNVALRAE